MKGGVIIKNIRNILLFLCCFFLNILLVTANESYDYTYTNVLKWGSDVESVNTAIINLSDNEGNVYNTYCIDYNTEILGDHNYSIVNLDDVSYLDQNVTKKISNVVINAYPFNDIEHVRAISRINDLTEEEAIAGAQAAIWHYANELNFELSDNVKLLYDYYLLLGDNEIDGTKITNLDIDYKIYFEEGIRNILIKINNDDVYDFNYSFDKNLTGEYGIEITENNNEILLKDVPEDIEFVLFVSGKQTINENVYFYYPTGGVSMSQSLVGVTKGEINVSNSKNIKVKDNHYNLTINKIDGVTSEFLENVTFKISNTVDFSELAFEGITNREGKVIFENLVSGKWYIKEVTTKDGYIISDEVMEIVIDNEDVVLDVKNYPFGKIKIIKENDLGIKLDNVYFDLYKDEVKKENLIKKDLITNEDGEILIDNLDKGTYVIVETKTKEGHLLNEKEIKVDVEYGKTSEVLVVNESIKYGSLIIRKISSEDNTLLKNATIGIYKDEECSELYKEIITTDKEYVLDNIEVGTYYVKEINAPKDYILNLDTYKVEIKEDNTINLEIINHKIYNTALNHYFILMLGILSFSMFTCLFIGNNLCLRKK